MDVLELGLAGKVAIVTGGSEGLGRACVERFAKSGAKVAACARRKDVLERAVDEIQKKTGADILAMSTDVTSGPEVEAFVAATVARFGGVDILVNNAGTSSAAGFEEVDDATWQYDFDSKVMGAIRFCRLVIPHMKRRGGGRIINVTTVGGKAPAARSLPTSMSRAAGINLTKSLAHEYAADKILVNTICLGLSRAPSTSAAPRAISTLTTATSRRSASCRSDDSARPMSSPISSRSSPPSARPISPGRPSTSMAASQRRCKRRSEC